ncbi:MAG: acetylglutamate kinase [Candidatus Omnitrophica bacterium]|nr:acetylglutamate kinase [Candidatus Omnitrophota bacterium]
MESIVKKASVLIEAIPYIHAFRRKIFVVKYGGSILDDDKIRHHVLQDIVFLSYVGIRIIIVHGGGPHINARVKEQGLKSEFVNGIRVTDKATLQIVGEELEKLNERIVAEIKALKGDVSGLKGQENIVFVEKKKAEKDLGFVGTITSVNKEHLESHLAQGRITVVSPMGITLERQPHNVNADEVASAIANSMKAEKLVLLTDVPGVMRDLKDPGTLFSTLTLHEVEELVKSGVIAKGMIPKVLSCVQALQGGGVRKTHIVDARLPHALLLEFFTDQGVGTQIIK